MAPLSFRARIRLVADALLHRRQHASAGQTSPAAPLQAIHPFDLRYNVDTSGLHRGPTSWRHRLALRNPARWSTAYYAIAPSVFDRALSLTHTPGRSAWSRFTFVDLGCGKGRALLLASRYPFRHIFGVELDPALIAIAHTNLSRFHADWQQCHSLEVQYADATTLAFPPTPLLVYLYHPFQAPILDRVLQHLQLSIDRNPRDLWLVYINPEAAHVLARFPFLHLHARTILALDPEDALPDRPGSTQEEVSVYHAGA